MTFYSVLLFVSFNFYCASGGLFDKKSCSPCRVDVVNLVKTENIQSFDSQTLYNVCEKALFGDEKDKNSRLAKLVKGTKTMEEKIKVIEPLIQKCEQFKKDPNASKPYLEGSSNFDKKVESFAKNICADLNYC